MGRARQLQLHRRIRLYKKTKIEPVVLKIVKKQYRGLEKRVRENLNRFKGVKDLDEIQSINQLYDSNIERQEALKAGREFSEASLILANDYQHELWQIEERQAMEYLEIQLVAEQLGKQYEDVSVESRKNELEIILRKALQEGESVYTFSSRLSDYFDALHGAVAWRGKRIARTETSRNMDRASYKAFRKIGVTHINIVGCEDSEGDCNALKVPLNLLTSLNLHPNHTGSAVPHYY